MSNLVFISHETPDGRPSRSKKALIHAHTLGHNRNKRTRRSGNAQKLNFKQAAGRAVWPTRQLVSGSTESAKTVLELDKVALSNTRVDLATSDEDHQNNQPTSVRAASGASVAGHAVSLRCNYSKVSAPVGTTSVGQDGEDVQNIGQWYFHSQLDKSRTSHFDQAQTHWTKGLWEMATINQPMFAAIGAFALHKEVTLAKRLSKAAYLEQKGRTIWHISNDLSKPQRVPDPMTMVAIGLLAYMDVKDGHFTAARTQLRAVRNLISISKMPTYAWLYCVWVDLRYALLTGRPPIIPHHVPLSLRRPASTRNPEDSRKASENVARCPQATFFTHEIAFELFEKLHALCRYQIQPGRSDLPPFGQVYDLEYSLRMIQSGASMMGQTNGSALAELVILTIQLHVWMACRFWAPQRQESHLAVLSRACDILVTFVGIDVRWADSGHCESLLWILFTMVASTQVRAGPHPARLLHLLRTTLGSLKIGNHKDFSARLSKWPWIEDWHPVQSQIVWTALSETIETATETKPLRDIEMSSVSTHDRLFLGVLEFFNGL